jgi:hypothetical protein
MPEERTSAQDFRARVSPREGGAVSHVATSGELARAARGCTLTTAGDLTGVDPQLGPLQDNGGPTPTHALAPTSPVLGFVTVARLCKPDQRGVKRKRPCDSGAFELP